VSRRAALLSDVVVTSSAEALTASITAVVERLSRLGSIGLALSSNGGTCRTCERKQLADLSKHFSGTKRQALNCSGAATLGGLVVRLE